MSEVCGIVVPSEKHMSDRLINVSRMSPKLLRTEPHLVENRGITMAPLFLRLTS